MRQLLVLFYDDLTNWVFGWYYYLFRKLSCLATRFEAQKDLLVDILVARRGTYQRPFLHVSLGVIFLVSVIAAPVVADTYPGAIPKSLVDYTPPSAVATSFDLAEYAIQTTTSEKPRDQIEIYRVASGDTLGKVAEKYSVSVDSMKWLNDIKGDSLSVGQEIKIPPVTGIVHKVKEGETVYTIAKKYKTDAQKIVNFPFNDFSDLDTFALSAGQSLVVPDGVMPEAPRIIVSQPPVFAGGTGQFLWPAGGVITQYPIWYHLAVDIANSASPGVAAAEDGMVSLVESLRYGYGQHIIVSHNDGLATLYAHLSEIYVKVGDRVARGQIIGRMGSSGRSTGTHLHFEVRKNGVIVNPLPFLR